MPVWAFFCCATVMFSRFTECDKNDIININYSGSMSFDIRKRADLLEGGPQESNE